MVSREVHRGGRVIKDLTGEERIDASQNQWQEKKVSQLLIAADNLETQVAVVFTAIQDCP